MKRLLFGVALCRRPVAMLLWAGVVDRSGKRVGNLILDCGPAALGLLLTVAFRDFWISFLLLNRRTRRDNGCRGDILDLHPRFLTGVAAAGGLTFINSVGTIYGFVGPAWSAG
jgi:MFS transporter, ACS family, tartrate transporter